MSWAPQWPNGLDTYGSFPGQPYTDGSEYILAAYADSWVLAIANLESYIGYGSGSASPTYSPVFGQNFGTIAARLVNVETVANSAGSSVSAVIPIGGIIEWANDSSPPANYLYLHGQTVSGGASTYPTLAALYPGWVSGSNLVMPDSRGRISIGAGGSYSSNQTGGAASITLNAFNIPQFANQFVSVTGTVSGGSVTGSFSGGTITGGTVNGSVTGTCQGTVNISDPTHTHALYVQEVGPPDAILFTTNVAETTTINTLQGQGGGLLNFSWSAGNNIHQSSTGITASFSGGTIAGNISGGTLTGASFSGGSLSGATLSGATLTGSGSVTFGNPSPTSFPIIPPVISFHKIVRAQ